MIKEYKWYDTDSDNCSAELTLISCNSFVIVFIIIRREIVAFLSNNYNCT